MEKLMSSGYFIPLQDRAILTIGGEEAVPFLQGLVSADVEKCTDGKAVWAAMLTPQGKYLFDFFILKVGDAFWLDCESARMMDLGRLFHKYKLRANVDLGIGEGMQVVAVLGGENIDIANDVTLFADPRLEVMGRRAILSGDNTDMFLQAGLVEGTLDQYHKLRIENGLPDGPKDMTPEKALLLENGFDELAGIGWEKGCFVGQELTARTKYRGLVKKRLLPFQFEGPTPASGAIIKLDDKEAGEVKSCVGNMGLALFRLERLQKSHETGGALTAVDTIINPKIPEWVVGVSN